MVGICRRCAAEIGGSFHWDSASGRHLPNGVEHGAIDPFDDSARTITHTRLSRLAAADFLNFSFDVLQWAYGEFGAFHGVEQVLTMWVDGDATFGGDDVDH